MLAEEALAVAAAIIQAVIAAKASGASTVDVASLVSRAHADAAGVRDGEPADDAAALAAIHAGWTTPGKP